MIDYKEKEEEVRNDYLLNAIDKFKGTKVHIDLLEQLSSFFELFPAEDEDLFIYLLNMVDQKQKSNFLKFATQYDILENPNLQLVLLQMLAPYNMLTSALKATIASGEVYDEQLTAIGNKFFLLFNNYMEEHFLKLEEFYLKINSVVTENMKQIDIFKSLLIAFPSECTKIAEKLTDEANTQKEVLEAFVTKLKSEIERDMKKVEKAFLENIQTETNKTFLKTINAWTSWLGALFLGSIVFTFGLGSIFVAKIFHLI
jgi:hypothetical protein